MTVHSVGFNGRTEPVEAGNAVRNASFDAYAEPHVAIHPGKDAEAKPVVNAPVNKDGLRGRQVVIVQLPGRKREDGTHEMVDFELSLSRIRSDGSKERLDAEFEYAELQRVAQRIERLAMTGELFAKDDFSAIQHIGFDLGRGDRREGFRLQRMNYTLNVGGPRPVDEGLYNAFVKRMQQELSNLGQTLGEVHNARRERCEQQRKHGEHPSQKNL